MKTRTPRRFPSGSRTHALLLSVALVALAGTVAVVTYRDFTEPAKRRADPTFDPPAGAPAGEHYRLTGRILLELAKPTGIAVTAADEILVSGDAQVVLLDAVGAQRAVFPLGEKPRCVASGAAGRVYLGMQDHVAVLDTATGVATEWAELDRRAIITSIAWSADTVYVADAGSGAVFAYDAQGKLLRRFGGFLIPSPFFDVAPAPGGSAWVADTGRHTVARYDREGRRSGAWGGYSRGPEGFSGCCNPAHIAVTPDGLIVTAEKGLLRIKLHTAGGDLLAVVATPGTFRAYEAALDLAVLRDGTILALLPRARQILMFRPGSGGGAN